MEDAIHLYHGKDDEGLAQLFQKNLLNIKTKDGRNESLAKFKDASAIYAEFRIERLNKNVATGKREAKLKQQQLTDAKPLGLYNHINSCFMSASLQCLSAVKAGELVQ